MLRTPSRVASCQPAAVLSVSCLVAVYLSFTHSTHSFGQPISRTFFPFSYLFFLISLFRDWCSNSLAPLQRRPYASACENIFSARAPPDPTTISSRDVLRKIHSRCNHPPAILFPATGTDNHPLVLISIEYFYNMPRSAINSPPGIY